MNDNDIWILAYMTTLWKTSSSAKAKNAADAALKAYRKEFYSEKE